MKPAHSAAAAKAKRTASASSWASAKPWALARSRTLPSKVRFSWSVSGTTRRAFSAVTAAPGLSAARNAGDSRSWAALTER